MVISSLSVSEGKYKRDIVITFASEKYKVLIDATATEHESTTHSFHKHVKIKVWLDKMYIENTFTDINIYLFNKLLEKKEELKKHLPKIAKIVIDELRKNYSVSLEEFYYFIINLLEKLIEEKDYKNIIFNFENNVQKRF
ncbi:MAG TPA: hypothetical protein EYH54_06540 [Nautiliaceae bacterium]|nr:hypothetical protein [Nautiliaceae bacterium]